MTPIPSIRSRIAGPVAERLAGRAASIARFAIVAACAGALAAAGRALPLAILG